MSFLLPQALWALPAAALPLIIHLISRTNTRLVEFSTLHFLRKMEHDSIRRLRWHQWLVVLLRTLLILVLVLLLARPVVKGYFHGWIGDRTSTFSVVVIDDSFSMSGEVSPNTAMRTSAFQSRSKPILEPLYHILSDPSNGGWLVIIRASDAKIIYEGPSADLPELDEIINQCTPRFHEDNLIAVMDTLTTDIFQSTAYLYANQELFLISDIQAHQQSFLKYFRDDTSMWGKWHFFPAQVPPHENNVAVLGAKVETAIPLVGELMDISVTLSNTGQQSRRKIPVQVVLNDVRSGQLVVDLRPNEKKTVRFQVAPTEPGHQQGYAEIDRDGRLGDNRFYFHTYIPPLIRILLIEPPELEPSFARLALRSLATETPHIQLRAINPDDLAWSPQEMEVLVLNSIGSITNLLLRQIEEFLRGGGILVVIPGTDETNQQFLATLQNRLGIPRCDPSPHEFDPPQSLDVKALQSSILRKIFQREAELDELSKQSRLYPIYPRGSDEVVLWLTGNIPLLTRSNFGDGTIFLFALPLHLEWTDLPLKASFIPMWHNLIFWRSASSVLADVRVGRSPILDITPREANQSLMLVDPAGVASLMIPNIRSRTVTLTGVDRPGIYTLTSQDRGLSEGRTGTGKQIQFRVNISDQELNGRVLSRSALAGLFPPGRTFFLEDGTSTEEWIQQARFGRELWRPFLYLLIFLLLLEMVLGNLYRSSRQTT